MPEPLNLGTEDMVTVNTLAEMIIALHGKDDLTLRHVEVPQGVRGREKQVESGRPSGPTAPRQAVDEPGGRT